MLNEISVSKVFPKQAGVFNNPYEKDSKRRVKDVSEIYKAPESARNSTYIDKNCPFTGEIKIKNNFMKGEVLKMKQPTTIVVVKRYLHYVKKYKRYERRYKNVSVHLSPCFKGLVNVGDTVICGETRPLSKTKRFVVVGFEKKEIKEKKLKMLSEI
ncbi:40S ribosomal protein S11 [Spraguea lophii 42_110]|uniref:Small ribosomal subunit protein uS17 n=1 Tax=Spraguea lophii (strain 42_110) TaxID=1358809 RepID=S7W8R0_SPRLO|nr:Chain SL0, 40S ribosomal protein S11 [Spraguea lophii 42_110]7QJH_RL0 Chain RL0, 40S ribosomal protein S11 [Spraguea lophii 42_110]7QJH_SL0 Chain SL0, 40S ribosomal protein S11 [Spraguea lophii 42_110]8BR3_SL0 Chain SL0, 40S ribosomal protein S11 [Spraguea lophii 42_110]8P5D_SL0 Chain SL0, 40S ribosomal protein S11 [Spraguea lophii 42_110]8P60_RL0 Chain RL0, 40S ribosomal protein S11 [Spraguea lophii 42_110]8P60_SL0 Chain SL0, 40S ribosomal protein S11 [Spraguea lophii 42_110]EPR79236.1 4